MSMQVYRDFFLTETVTQSWNDEREGIQTIYLHLQRVSDGWKEILCPCSFFVKQQYNYCPMIKRNTKPYLLSLWFIKVMWEHCLWYRGISYIFRIYGIYTV